MTLMDVQDADVCIRLDKLKLAGGGRDPFERVLFYEAATPNVCSRGVRTDLSYVESFPHCAEAMVRVYVKDDRLLEAARRAATDYKCRLADLVQQSTTLQKIHHMTQQSTNSKLSELD